VNALSEWSKFFVLRLPVAALVIALGIEAAAWPLSGVTLHRHSVDDLATAVLHDRHPYRVVLLGDSVTHNVAHKYRIGNAGEVADLTTHAFAGLPSSLFLLKRYLESGHRPREVIIAASRDVYTIPIQKDTFTYYLTSTFTEPYEREFLQRHYADYVNYSWRPAALSITTKIGEPVFSLLRRPGDTIWTAPEIPAATPVLESFADEPYPKQFQERLDEPTDVRPEARAILDEFCVLSRQYGFSLHLVWPPVQIRLHQALQANGTLAKINGELAAIFKDDGVAVTIEDSDAGHDYPYFDRDLVHIKGEGWEQLYANQLTADIHRYDATPQGQDAPTAARQR
jgi:hypothetical protein